MQKPIGFTKANIISSATAQGRSALFLAALAFTLPEEGVYDELVAGDPGQETCCGVTQACYDAWRSRHLLPSRSVGLITAVEVASVYWEDPWSKLGCDNWQSPIPLVMFDTGVNTGWSEAVMLMQHALGLTVDGVYGAATAAAEHDYVVKHGALALATAIIAQRRAFYHKIPDPSDSIDGWLARCDDLEAAIKA